MSEPDICTAVLQCPMDPNTNDARANTIAEYLVRLLSELWREQDGFSGKHPFGNSSWEYDLYVALIREGLVHGTFNEFDELDNFDSSEKDKANILIDNAILSLDDILRE